MATQPVLYARIHPLTHKALRKLADKTGLPMATVTDRLLRKAMSLPSDAIGDAVASYLRKETTP